MGSFEQKLQYILSMFNSVLDFETKTFVVYSSIYLSYGQNNPKKSLPISMLIFLKKDQNISEFVLLYDLK